MAHETLQEAVADLLERIAALEAQIFPNRQAPQPAPEPPAPVDAS
jgi:hypothetical protein